MSANSKTVSNLQAALAMEIAAAHRYMLHAHVLEDWGLDKLAEQMRGEMHEELQHAQEYTRRIMFMKGDPEVKAAKAPQRAQTLRDMFMADLADEEQGPIRFYTEAAQAAAEATDIGTRMLFEKIVMDEEGHKSWLELQLDLLQRIGEQSYVAKYITVAGGEK